MEKKRKIGLLILTPIKHMGLVAISYTQGIVHARNLMPLPFPGSSEVTLYADSDLHDDQNQTYILIRNAEERYGENSVDIFFSNYNHHLQPFEPSVFKFSSDSTNVFITAKLVDDSSLLHSLRVPLSSSGIRLITQDMLCQIRILDDHDKEHGMMRLARSQIGMTYDTFKAFENAFLFFGKREDER